MKIKRFDSARLDRRDIALKLKEILDLCYGESPWSEVYLLSNLKRDVYFLAEVDDEVVGFLAVQVVMEEMEITNLAVKPEFRSKKIASALMEQINNFSGTLFLEVRKSNKLAQNLYKKYNFEAFYTRKNYYSHPTEDAILMRKIQ
ncbi:ribosomal protein S18-alanine N-acetyltransferase [Lactococcus formosensis]|jgi:ribosomal-protein-alanine N-acetyltransferase|uniref:[Ribosomal protein bS18]-alanine N-acetyltransferase n=1 Tax=Lactococcus formosensis TaxID=1281486 RepID=A0A9Q8Y2A9_9LACT|nr:ribosomal protein S18-alanine N-acetyltransferase [Lactococcus formosensis]MCH1723776.1 ribosomal protein S18-alanine N-acetyltransferase [Lactococcus formosensis]MCO7180811.1 ribosomal protein S18-alanine N-acetyltransferase [Lactococcus formosensis]MDG6111802.1 ribosomal protein S18-alanine N-acetyltransferase [Lactococcus formosensis]MDG6114116.1 ribosomal protein S18-alanine N-acetyltransferase [Lactococcus formosensis]MDG6116203.1 ribosomal protein S18-alanine N-acetyltransferase [Lact